LANTPANPIVRLPGNWSDVDRFIVRVGATCTAFGALGHVLPPSGLQLIKLSRLGPNTGPVATGLIVIGAAMIAWVLLFKGRGAKIAMWGVITGVIVLVGMGGLLWAAKARDAARFPRSPQIPGPSQVPAMPPSAGVPMPMGARSGVPFGDTRGAQGVPSLNYESLCAQYGRERVVRVKLSGAESVDLGKTIKMRIEDWPGERPKAWSVRAHAADGELLLAPVTDIQACAAALSMGSVTATDSAEHVIAITVDPSVCAPKTAPKK
jgi:hypothetical protein